MSDVTIHAERRVLLKEFIDKKCHRFTGAKVKSSRLFEIFKDYYDDKNLPVAFEKAYNQTSFTMLMKQLSTFDTKREKDGMYWIDLHLGDSPPVLPTKPVPQKESVSETEVSIDEVEERPPNAMTFAEFFKRGGGYAVA